MNTCVICGKRTGTTVFVCPSCKRDYDENSEWVRALIKMDRRQMTIDSHEAPFCDTGIDEEYIIDNNN